MVKNGVYLLLYSLLAWCCTSNMSFAANIDPYIELSIDADEIYLGDTVILTVESTGLLDPIDVALLETAVRFERETTGTRIAVYQGKVAEIALRRMELTPTKTGPLVLGPVTAGSITSNSVSVNVLDTVRSDWSPSADDLAIDVRVSTPDPYIHSQLTLDIELKHRYEISDEKIQLPDLNGFLNRAVFEARRTFTDDSQDFRSTAWRYLLFPEQSGPTTIGAVNWTGITIKSRPERAAFERVTSPINLRVKAAALEDSQWWLPASSLELQEEWSSELTAIKAGDELNRTIHIKAVGVQAGQIPEPIIHESRAISQALISAVRNDTITNNQITATAEFVYRVKAKSPIPVFLDTVRVVWWNTTTNTSAEAIIPARRINVGLPDRADLLKAIALTQSGTSSLTHWVQSASGSRMTIIALALLSAVILSIKLLPRLLGVLSSRVHRYRVKRELRQVVRDKDWKGLYLRLNALESQGWIVNRLDPIVISLQKKMFSSNDVTISTAEVRRFIRRLEPLNSANNSGIDHRHRDALAEL